MNTNCPKCDRPDNICKGGRECVEHSVDWRQRALFAEKTSLALATLIRDWQYAAPDLYGWAERWLDRVPKAGQGGN